jgi:hypothetical protein
MEVSKSAGMREQAERMFELTALRNWLRRRPLLRRLYQCLPSVYRERISKQWARQMATAAQFPELPSVPLQYEALVGGNTKSPGVVEGGRRGANLFAYFRGEFGLAEAARSYARALISTASAMLHWPPTSLMRRLIPSMWFS